MNMESTYRDCSCTMTLAAYLCDQLAQFVNASGICIKLCISNSELSSIWILLLVKACVKIAGHTPDLEPELSWEVIVCNMVIKPYFRLFSPAAVTWNLILFFTVYPPILVFKKHIIRSWLLLSWLELILLPGPFPVFINFLLAVFPVYSWFPVFLSNFHSQGIKGPSQIICFCLWGFIFWSYLAPSIGIFFYHFQFWKLLLLLSWINRF